MSGGSGWLFTGAVFWLMAAGGLVPVMGAAVRWLRRGGQPQPATAGGTFEELLLLTLSPQQPRNMRAHPGLRAAVCGANVFDLWLAGAPVPADLRRYIRKHNYGD